jgi:hypothetical protein
MTIEKAGPLQQLLREMRRALKKLTCPGSSAAKPEGERRDYARRPGASADLERRKDDDVGGEG